MDPLGIAGMPMTLGSQPGTMGDMGPGAGGAGEGDGDKASPSKVCGDFAAVRCRCIAPFGCQAQQ